MKKRLVNGLKKKILPDLKTNLWRDESDAYDALWRNQAKRVRRQS